jgi:CheY-like chemotaxis protein
MDTTAVKRFKSPILAGFVKLQPLELQGSTGPRVYEAMRHNLHNRLLPGGRGSGGASRRRFLVILPGAMAAACRVLGARPQAETHSPARRQGRPRRLVYVVDDTVELTALYRLLLEDAGYAVRTFTDRADALCAFLADDPRPVLLITDYVGYPISAEALMAECRRAQPGLRILMVSGCVESSLCFTRTRPDRYLQKPFAIEHFLAAVRSLTGSPSRGAASSLQDS